MKILIAGNAVVVESTITKAMMDAAMKYNPDALVVVDEDNNETYRVSEGAVASVSKYGTQFDGVNDGNMTATLIMGHSEDKVEAAKETYGIALAALANAESIIIEAISEVTGTVDSVFANATIVGQADTETEA